jgi:hypothetical protein
MQTTRYGKNYRRTVSGLLFGLVWGGSAVLIAITH